MNPVPKIAVSPLIPVIVNVFSRLFWYTSLAEFKGLGFLSITVEISSLQITSSAFLNDFSVENVSSQALHLYVWKLLPSIILEEISINSSQPQT